MELEFFKEMPSEVINGPNTTYYVRRPKPKGRFHFDSVLLSYLAPTISLSNSRPMAPSLALARVFV